MEELCVRVPDPEREPETLAELERDDDTDTEKLLVLVGVDAADLLGERVADTEPVLEIDALEQREEDGEPDSDASEEPVRVRVWPSLARAEAVRGSEGVIVALGAPDRDNADDAEVATEPLLDEDGERELEGDADGLLDANAVLLLVPVVQGDRLRDTLEVEERDACEDDDPDGQGADDRDSRAEALVDTEAEMLRVTTGDTDALSARDAERTLLAVAEIGTDAAGERDDDRVELRTVLPDTVTEGEGETLDDLEVDTEWENEAKALAVLEVAGERVTVIEAEGDRDRVGDALSVPDADTDREMLELPEVLGERDPDNASDALAEPQRDPAVEPVPEREPLTEGVLLRDELVELDTIGERDCETVAEEERESDGTTDGLPEEVLEIEGEEDLLGDTELEEERESDGERLAEVEREGDRDADVDAEARGEAEPLMVPLAETVDVTLIVNEGGPVAVRVPGSSAGEYVALATVALRDANDTLARKLTLGERVESVREAAADAEGDRDVEGEPLELDEGDVLREVDTVADVHIDLSDDTLRRDEREEDGLPEGDKEALVD